MTVFSPTDRAPSERPRPIPEGTSARITRAPQDFYKRTPQGLRGLVCQAHPVWTDGCTACEIALAKRTAERAEAHTAHVARTARTGRFGK